MIAQTAGSAPDSLTRDAIIFIPGLNFAANQSLDNIVQQISDAMEHTSDTKSAVFSVETSKNQVKDSTTHAFNYRTIVRKDNNTPTMALDIYEMDYLDSFTHDYDKVHPVILLLRMLLVVIMNFSHLISLVRSSAKNHKEKLQIFFALFAVGLILIYIGIVGMAVIDLVRALPEFQPFLRPAPSVTVQPTATVQANPATYPAPAGSQTSPEGASSTKSSSQAPISFLSQWVIVLVALAQLAAPKIMESFRHGLQKSAINFLSVIDYLSLSTRREPIEGYFLDLLECLGEGTAAGPYRSIYVMTYSFGGIVALDGIFPSAHDPIERTNIIDGIVTIGNPFDFCRSIWPKYFEHRKGSPDKKPFWINVYSPIDILGSNFRDDEKVDVSDINLIKGLGIEGTRPQNIAYPRNISYKDFGFLELITFIGLRSHAAYFPPVAEGETTCFTEIMPQLLKNSAWLA